MAKDAAFIREDVILPLLDAGKDVVLAMHSYGGMPGPVAAKGLSKTERLAAGKRGGIIGLVFLSVLVAFEGKSLVTYIGGELPGWITQEVSSLFVKGTWTGSETNAYVTVRAMAS